MLDRSKVFVLLESEQVTKEMVLAVCDNQLNAVDQTGLTLLHWAIKLNKLNVVELLLNEALDFNTKDNSGDTPLDSAIRLSRLDLIPHLLEKLLNKSKGYSLHTCIETENATIATLLLKHKADPNTLNAEQQTPLHLALSILPDPTIFVGLLLEHSADYLIEDKQKVSALEIIKNKKDQTQLTSLVKAIVSKEDKDSLNYLLKEKVFSINDTENVLFRIIIELGKIEIIEWLLDQELITNQDIQQHKNSNGDTALLLAARNGQTKFVQWLLDQKLTTPEDIQQQKNNNGDTALLLAAWNGQTEFVQWLLDQKLTSHEDIPQQKSNYGNTALLLAAQNGQTKFVQWLLDQKLITTEDIRQQKNNNGHTVLLLATWNGHTKFVQWLLDQKLITTEDIRQQKNNNGQTVLLLAAWNGHTKFVQWLLDQKLVTTEDIQQQKDEDGDTALLLAAWNGQTKFVQWLLDQKLITTEDIQQQKNSNGNTALLLAARNGQTEFVQWLLDQKLTTPEDIQQQKNSNGNTASSLAAWNGQTEFVQWLLGQKIITIEDIQQQKSNYGNTALLLAAWNGQTKFVQWLLNQKIITTEDIRQQKNNNGQTVLLLAARKGHTLLVNWLLNNNYACIFDKDNEEKNVFSIASDQKEMLALLERAIILILNYQVFNSPEEEYAFINRCQDEFASYLYETFFDQQKISFYQRYEENEKAYTFCMSILDNVSSSVKRKANASVNIAEMIFNGSIDFNENDSEPDKLKTNPENNQAMSSQQAELKILITRVIQAYKYACVNLETAKILRSRFDTILAGNLTPNISRECQIPWLLESLELFSQYYGNKNSRETPIDIIADEYRLNFREEKKKNNQLTFENEQLQAKLQARESNGKNSFFSASHRRRNSDSRVTYKEKVIDDRNLELAASFVNRH